MAKTPTETVVLNEKNVSDFTVQLGRMWGYEDQKEVHGLIIKKDDTEFVHLKGVNPRSEGDKMFNEFNTTRTFNQMFQDFCDSCPGF